MEQFDRERLENLIEDLEIFHPFDLSIELQYCGEKGWHCDVLIEGKSRGGAMLDDVDGFLLLEQYIINAAKEQFPDSDCTNNEGGF